MSDVNYPPKHVENIQPYADKQTWNVCHKSFIKPQLILQIVSK